MPPFIPIKLPFHKYGFGALPWNTFEKHIEFELHSGVKNLRMNRGSPEDQDCIAKESVLSKHLYLQCEREKLYHMYHTIDIIWSVDSDLWGNDPRLTRKLGVLHVDGYSVEPSVKYDAELIQNIRAQLHQENLEDLRDLISKMRWRGIDHGVISQAVDIELVSEVMDA